MADVTAHSASSVSKGKGPEEPTVTNGGFRPQVPMAVMAVQPPRQEDLQRSYAAVVDSNANPKGWYGSMSMSHCT